MTLEKEILSYKVSKLSKVKVKTDITPLNGEIQPIKPITFKIFFIYFLFFARRNSRSLQR